MLQTSRNTLVLNRGDGIRSGTILRYSPNKRIILNGGIAMNRDTLIRNYAIKSGDLVKVRTAVLGRTIINEGYVVKTKTLIPRKVIVPSGSITMNIPTQIVGAVQSSRLTRGVRGTGTCIRVNHRRTTLNSRTRGWTSFSPGVSRTSWRVFREGSVVSTNGSNVL